MGRRSLAAPTPAPPCAVQMSLEHGTHRGLDIHHAIPALAFDGDFLPVPDRATNEHASIVQVEIIDMQAEQLPGPHSAAGEQCEHNLPLSLSELDNSLHLISAAFSGDSGRRGLGLRSAAGAQRSF